MKNGRPSVRALLLSAAALLCTPMFAQLKKPGLSYGKYMLLKMQANKRACPCANTDKPKV